MLQITLAEPGRFEARQTAVPAPGPGESLVRVTRIGVCGTDLHAFRGRQPFFTYPRVLGHELAGEVLEVGDAESSLRPGDRVAVEPYLACGECRTCRQGRPNCCTRLRVLGVHTDGGMGEYLVAPARLLHTSSTLEADQLALIETLGIGFHAVRRARVQAGEIAVVVGAGPIGLAVTQFAALAGARTVIVDTNPARCAFARSMGAADAITGAEDLPAAMSDLVGPELAHCVFDATGNLQAMGQSIRLAGPGARVVMVGLAQGNFEVDDPLFHRRELTLLASRNSAGAFPEIIRLMETGQLDTTPWITHRLGLAEVPDRFSELLEPGSGVIKAMITA